jgi:hypothetical protein
MTDWAPIKVEYESTTTSIRKLAKAFGITDTAIRLKARDEGWSRNTGLEKHIDRKTKAIIEVQECEHEEAKMPVTTRVTVQQKVMDRVSAINMISSMQNDVLVRLQGLLDHDRSVHLVLGEEASPHAYGKAKIASEIIATAKKNMLGDAPIIDMNDDLGKSDESDEWVVVIPAQEKKRLDEVDSENS